MWPWIVLYLPLAVLNCEYGLIPFINFLLSIPFQVNVWSSVDLALIGFSLFEDRIYYPLVPRMWYLSLNIIQSFVFTAFGYSDVDIVWNRIFLSVVIGIWSLIRIRDLLDLTIALVMLYIMYQIPGNEKETLVRKRINVVKREP